MFGFYFHCWPLSGDRRTGSLLEKLMEKKNEFPKPLIDSAHSKYQCSCAWRMRMLLLWLETHLLLLWLQMLLLWWETSSVFAWGLDEKKTQMRKIGWRERIFLWYIDDALLHKRFPLIKKRYLFHLFKMIYLFLNI